MDSARKNVAELPKFSVKNNQDTSSLRDDPKNQVNDVDDVVILCNPVCTGCTACTLYSNELFELR